MPRITNDTNLLIYGDNIDIFHMIDDEFIDLIYLDPPFNSARDFNVIFKKADGYTGESQISAFEDTWTWDKKTEQKYIHYISTHDTPASRTLRSFREMLGTSDMMAYLAMMTPRLSEMHRILRSTGSIYLHCDPVASHYLKIVMDSIFGPSNFRNEIVWKRTGVHSDSKTWSRVSDTILFYTKSNTYTWNPIYSSHDEKYIREKYRYTDSDGRRYRLDNMTSPNPRENLMYEWQGFSPPSNGWRYSKETMQKLHNENRIYYPDSKDKRPQLKRYLDDTSGVLMGNVWTDIAPLNSQAKERLGYPTQKPEGLLERIIYASSNKGDIVLDPFCGCGTTIAAAQKLKRKWIGIDITSLATTLIKWRLQGAYNLQPNIDYKIIGLPTSLEDAKALALEDSDKTRKQFEMWAISLVGGQPRSEGKKGSDKGIDGVYNFIKSSNDYGRLIISVKSGKITPSMIRDLSGVIEREGADGGIFITLQEPTKDCIGEILDGKYFKASTGSRVTEFPRLQIVTVAELLSGELPKLPIVANPYLQASKRKMLMSEERSLF